MMETYRPRRVNSRVLASAAIVALVTAGGVGGVLVTASPHANAAAVSTDNLNAQAMPSFATLIDRVKPAVVSIKVKMFEQSSADQRFASLPPEIQKFLKQFGEQNGAPYNPRSLVIGEGSGFFVSSDGYIVTNNHVVQNAKSVLVTMDDGKTLDAKVVGTDPKTDVAVIKVDQPGDYPFVSFSKENPKIGDWVVAIGNPYGLGGTVTAGIISAKGRDIGDSPYDRFLQIDAPINKGNSGGPTFDEQGHVVGMNTAIYSPSGGSIGIGFAIPAGTIEPVVDALEHGGVVQRGYLGVEIQAVSPEIAEALGLKAAEGAMVDKPMPNSPASSAGLKPGDVIQKVNGQDIKDAGDLTRQIGQMKPGDKVELTYLSDGAGKTASVTLTEQQAEKAATAAADDQASPTPSALGLELAPAKQVRGAGQSGVAVVGVEPNGVAAQQGFATGDVILSVGGKTVSTPQDVKSGIADARNQGRKAVLLRVQTAEGARFVAIELPKA